MNTTIKDSGQREEFATGSRRDTRKGKGRFDLMSPIVAARDAAHLEGGAEKYGDRNWEQGQPLSRFMDSAMRHLNRFMEGHRDEDHLAAARWNIGALMHTEEMIRRGRLPGELNDLPSYLLAAEKEEKAEPAQPRNTVTVAEYDWPGDGFRGAYWRVYPSGCVVFVQPDGSTRDSAYTPLMLERRVALAGSIKRTREILVNKETV